MKFKVTIDRFEEDGSFKYTATIPGMVPRDGDTPGDAFSELGAALDAHLVDMGWNDLVKKTKPE